MRRSTLAASLVILAAPAAAVAEAPPAKAAAKLSRFVDRLPIGRRVIVFNVENTASFDVHLVARPTAKPPKGEYRVIRHGKDYVTLQAPGRPLRHLPVHSIRSIVESSKDPLSMPITGKFRRVSLQDYVGQISKLIGIEIRIDGTALKGQGYTRNMPQNATADKTAAAELLRILVAKYPPLVLTVHDDHYQLTTRAAAKAAGATVRELAHAKPRK